ncbi:hypothetical protein KIPB_014990, partial [Kipferlia bialata]|eukprot:g14990.t1
MMQIMPVMMQIMPVEQEGGVLKGEFTVPEMCQAVLIPVGTDARGNATDARYTLTLKAERLMTV